MKLPNTPLQLDSINCLNQASLPDLEAALRGWQVPIFYLHGENARDKASFLTQIDKDLPKPDGAPLGNLEALADRLQWMLTKADGARIALVWTQADCLVYQSLQDFLAVFQVLNDFARQTGSAEADVAREKALNVFLTGDGPSFTNLICGD